MSANPKRYGLYCLKSPSGALHYDTLAEYQGELDRSPEDAVWSKGGFRVVAAKQGEDWQKKYWKNWDASIANAKRLRWKFVQVYLKEIPQ